MELRIINTYLVIDGAGLPYTVCIEKKDEKWYITNVFYQCFNNLGFWEKENINDNEFKLRCGNDSPQIAYNIFQKFNFNV